jgi:hypothetical protein
MSQAIANPRSNYRPSDALMSVDHFVASTRLVGENELRAFFYAINVGNDPAAVLDDARQVFVASLAVRLCQQSHLPISKIFTILLDRLLYGIPRDVDRELRLFRILPLLRSLKRSRTQGNAVVNASDTNDVPLSELESIIIRSCTTNRLYVPEDVCRHKDIMILSLLAAPNLVNEAPREGRSLAAQIVRGLDVNMWRGAFEYFNHHREPDYLPLPVPDVHFGTRSGQLHPSRNSSLDSTPKQAVKQAR